MKKVHRRFTMQTFVISGFVVAALFGGALSASAQESGSVSVLGGVSQYDLSGTGSISFVSGRGTTSLDRLFLAEAAVGYFAYTSQGQDDVHYLLPELQGQVQWLRDGVRPYLGAGVGASFAWADAAESSTDLTLSGAAGVRWPVMTGWGVQGELRVRSIDPWASTTAEWGLGVFGRF